jgi:hypothetical protein
MSLIKKYHTIYINYTKFNPQQTHFSHRTQRKIPQLLSRVTRATYQVPQSGVAGATARPVHAADATTTTTFARHHPRPRGGREARAACSPAAAWCPGAYARCGPMLNGCVRRRPRAGGASRPPPRRRAPLLTCRRILLHLSERCL